jgi:predicted nucleic-acid-binding Zn-ribbon protein
LETAVDYTFTCVKCGATEAETGELRTTGSGFTRFLNVQNQRYGTVSCAECGYTELYKRGGGGRIGNIFDFLTN